METELFARYPKILSVLLAWQGGTGAEFLAGNDLKIGKGYPKRLPEAMKRSLISRAELEVSAKRVLEFLLKLD